MLSIDHVNYTAVLSIGCCTLYIDIPDMLRTSKMQLAYKATIGSS